MNIKQTGEGDLAGLGFETYMPDGAQDSRTLLSQAAFASSVVLSSTTWPNQKLARHADRRAIRPSGDPGGPSTGDSHPRASGPDPTFGL